MGEVLVLDPVLVVKDDAQVGQIAQWPDSREETVVLSIIGMPSDGSPAHEVNVRV